MPFEFEFEFWTNYLFTKRFEFAVSNSELRRGATPGGLPPPPPPRGQGPSAQARGGEALRLAAPWEHPGAMGFCLKVRSYRWGRNEIASGALVVAVLLFVPPSRPDLCIYIWTSTHMHANAHVHLHPDLHYMHIYICIYMYTPIREEIHTTVRYVNK